MGKGIRKYDTNTNRLLAIYDSESNCHSMVSLFSVFRLFMSQSFNVGNELNEPLVNIHFTIFYFPHIFSANTQLLFIECDITWPGSLYSQIEPMPIWHM